MVWYICIAITLALLVLGILFFVKTKLNVFVKLISLLLTLFISTFIIYLPIYVESDNLLYGIFANFVHTLQVITVDTDFSEFHSVIATGITSPIFYYLYTLIRGSLHLLLPLVSAFSAFNVLIKCLSSFELFFASQKKTPMYIFSEYNERSLAFTDSLKDTKCDIVFTEIDDDTLTNKRANKRSFIYKEESICALEPCKTKDKEVHYFCLTKDEDKALSQALKLIEKLSQLPEEIQEKIHIYLFSTYKDYSTYIDSANKGLLNLHCVNEYETQVQNLLDKYPLISTSKNKIHVLLYGFDNLNQIALKNIVWVGQIAGFTLKISIVGTYISDQVEKAKFNAPNLFNEKNNISVYDCKNQAEEFEVVKKHCNDANYIIVNGKTDNQTMEQGIELRRLFYCSDKTFTYCPPIYCYVNDVSKHNILKNLATAESNPKRKMSYDLIAFGCINEVYSCENLLNSDLENLSKNVHLAYEEIFSDGPIDVKEALKRYNLFEVNKRSNRANALHIRYKLRLLGLDYVESDGEVGEELKNYYTKESLDLLSRAEHDRWMAFLESEGWTQSTKEDVYAYRQSGISKGRHNCPLLKKHPYICEYDALKELSIDLEGKDTTVYDEQLILRIPDILGNKWNISKKQYKVVKLTPKNQ